MLTKTWQRSSSSCCLLIIYNRVVMTMPKFHEFPSTISQKKFDRLLIMSSMLSKVAVMFVRLSLTTTECLHVAMFNHLGTCFEHVLV